MIPSEVKEKLRKYIETDDKTGLKNELTNLLRNLLRSNRDFNDFDDAWQYVKDRIPDFEDTFNEEQTPFEPREQWNRDYLLEQIMTLKHNFCQERIDHIKAVSQVLRRHKTSAPPQQSVTPSFSQIGSNGNPNGAVSAQLKQDVEEKNIRHIINDLIIIIHNDRGLYTSEFEDSLAYVKRAGLTVEEPFNGKAFADESQWNDDYWARQMAELRFNFCRERIDHVKAIGRKLYPPKTRPQRNEQTHQQRTSSSQETYYRQQGGSGTNFPMKTIGVVAAIVIIGAILLCSRN